MTINYRTSGWGNYNAGSYRQLITLLTPGTDYTFYYYRQDHDGRVSPTGQRLDDGSTVSIYDYIKVIEVQ